MEPLLRSAATGRVSWGDEEFAFIGDGALRFMAMCTALEREAVANLIEEVELSEDDSKRILAFADKYGSLGSFLTRMYRIDQGYENELTRLVTQPNLFVGSKEPWSRMEIYSHDKLLVTSRMELDGAFRFAATLLRHIRRSLEDLREIDTKFLQDVLKSEDVKRAQEHLARVIELTTPSSASQPAEPPAPIKDAEAQGEGEAKTEGDRATEPALLPSTEPHECK